MYWSTVGLYKNPLTENLPMRTCPSYSNESTFGEHLASSSVSYSLTVGHSYLQSELLAMGIPSMLDSVFAIAL